ncbi:MAG TPA: DUF1697 domain-containing protein [Pseudonocardiaceae bacterium]|nr:DUF1697 domain-containing protein [Pseudonocardiaceae bacterium]
MARTVRMALLLKGVNVGGNNKLPMAELRAVLADELGWRDVVTLLQSGNVVADVPAGDAARASHDAIAARFGLDIEVFAWSGREIAGVVADNPFPGKVDEPKLLHVAFLREAPPADWFAETGLVHDSDEFALGRRHIYLSYRDNARDSPLATVLRRSKLSFTARNWSTVLKLAELTG